MKASVIAGAVLGGLIALVSPMQAQQVSADIVFRSGPVAGRVAVADDGYSTYRRRPAYRPAPASRVVVVERVHRHRHPRHWKRHGFRPVTLYYVNGRYHDRWVGHRHGVREVIVYERDGRYYHDCDDDRRHHRHWDD
jgi:hypothetical protein